MIPRKVHVCWFGRGQKSAKVERCLRSIEGLRDHGYEILVWDEDNFDIASSAALQKAYDARKWSLVANYVRLAVLREHGGIYLDTDVEVVNPFDPLLSHRMFLGFMWDCCLGTAVIGAEPRHPIVEEILFDYDNVHGALRSPNNDTFTDYFLENVEGFCLSGESQIVGDDVFVAEKFAFEQPSLMKRKNFSIHHFEQSWKGNSSLKSALRAAAIRYGSLYLYRKYVYTRSLLISPYFATFLQHRQRGLT